MDPKSKLTALQTAKDILLLQFDDGDITFQIMMSSLEKLQQEERDILFALSSPSSTTAKNFRNAGLVAAIFLAGFFVSPYIYPALFGYKNAEECVIHSKHKWSVGACYDLYPTLKQP